MATRTRKYTHHPIFGEPSDLPPNVLPTTGDVLRYVWKLKCDMEETNLVKQFRTADKNTTIKQTIVAVTEKWGMSVADRKNMPLKISKAMESLLKRLYEKGVGLNANINYAICQLHGNDFPFRAVFYFYDGKPTGPASWTGPIGQQIKRNLSSHTINSFQPIPFEDFPSQADDIVKNLSWDQ